MEIKFGKEINTYKELLEAENGAIQVKLDAFGDPIRTLVLDKYMFKNNDHFNKYKATQYEAGFRFHEIIPEEVTCIINEEADKQLKEVLSNYIDSDVTMKAVMTQVYDICSKGFVKNFNDKFNGGEK